MPADDLHSCGNSSIVKYGLATDRTKFDMGIEMNKLVFILLATTLCFATACSKTDTAAKPGGPAAQQVDYKKICEHLLPLAPEARKTSLAQTCEADYQKLLPSCRNASAVTDCYVKMKSWDERLACMDSCVRDAGAEKK